MSSEIKKIFGYDFDKDFGEEFYTLVESKKLIFFVGAGVSRLMGLPGWNELATNLIKEAFPNYIEHTTILNSIKDSKELISISYNEMKNSEDKEEKFFKCFGKALTPKKNFTFEKNVYELLSKFEANFLTTNADNLFEEILGEERCHVGPNKPDFNRFRKHLYYLHGHYTSNKNHDQDYLVFTAEQYIQRYNDTDFQAFLHSVFNQGNTIIFIGYGLNEFEIIDYIVTKIGGINQTKVYLFEPFCSNQEIIYRSRKSYFETLNIKLVPYDISEKGYMQLIDVLEYLYNKISKNVFIPIIDDFKKWCSRFDDKSSFKEILSQLKKEDNISHERTIVDELRKQNDSRWIKSFYEEGLFSPSFIDKKIISNDWPLLSLFLDWVSSGDLYAQNNAVCFLNLLSTNNIEQLKKNRFGVASTISSLILNLNNSLINNKFLTILADIVDLQGVLYYDKDNNDKLFYNIIRWHKNHINKVLEIIFSFANFEVYNDSNSFDIKRIMHRINNVIKDSKNNKKIIVVMFEFFVGLLLKLANKKQFNLFMRIYNIDNINKNNNEYWKIIIGGKGTGKTQILKGIQQHFESMQNDSVSAYYASDTKNTYASIIKTSLSEKDFDLFGCSDCSKEFEYIKIWKIPALTKTSDYYQWLINCKGNKNFGFTNASFKDTFNLDQYDNEYDLFKENKESVNTILKNDINKYLDEEEALQMKTLLLKLLDKHKEKVIYEFSKAYSIYLENLTINKMKELYQIKKGKNSKPNSTGLMLLYDLCYKLNKSVEIIINNIENNKKVIYETIGRLPNKGFVYVEKSLVLNPDLSNFTPNKYYKRGDLKTLKKQLILIKNNIYNDGLTRYISDLNNKLNESNIESLKSFMQMKSVVVLSGNDPQNDSRREYTPSNGEQSMLILNHSLYKNKEVYILDEPEMSVGHDYINNIIVPRIIELSRLGKTVVVSTHDANIAVRTLPFIMIYRMEDGIKKKTYFGNPFNDNMINIDDNQDRISWAKTCIDTLEGGSIAFRERANYN